MSKFWGSDHFAGSSDLLRSENNGEDCAANACAIIFNRIYKTKTEDRPMINKIALAGCGNVGTALLEILHEKKDELREKYGFEYKVVLVSDLTKGVVANADGIDLAALEEAFKGGVKLFLFSNPNNPAGCVYSRDEILKIAALAKQYGATLIVDELYSRQVYAGVEYTHLCAQSEIPENLITIIGPSKTESLSGYRLGAAFGTAEIIDRMEKLQAIMSLRCGGYNQAVFRCWFSEPEGWLAARVAEHQRIRDDIMAVIKKVPGVTARQTDGGSYLFVTIPELEVSLHQFIRIARAHANVTVTPGTEFGPQFLHSFRINFSQDHDKAVAAMERLFKLMELYRK